MRLIKSHKITQKHTRLGSKCPGHTVGTVIFQLPALSAVACDRGFLRFDRGNE